MYEAGRKKGKSVQVYLLRTVVDTLEMVALQTARYAVSCQHLVGRDRQPTPSCMETARLYLLELERHGGKQAAALEAVVRLPVERDKAHATKYHADHDYQALRQCVNQRVRRYRRWQEDRDHLHAVTDLLKKVGGWIRDVQGLADRVEKK
jgi:hypothetical protein